MKTEELSGANLDYWVAKAEGIEHPPCLREMQPGCCLVKVEDQDEEGTVSRWVAFQPSSTWAVAGPIIDREKLELTPLYDMRNRFVYWSSQPAGKGNLAMTDGDPLVAAMRAYVAGKFGDEVDDLTDHPA